MVLKKSGLEHYNRREGLFKIDVLLTAHSTTSAEAA